MGESPVHIRRFFTWCFIIAVGLITLSVGYISLVSIWVGFTHLHRSGSWLPVSAGILIVAVVFPLYFCGARALLHRLHWEDTLDM